VNFTRVILNCFRNFEKTEVTFSDRTNLIVGPNGSGKSNILEAVFYLCTAKSFRGATDDQMRMFSSDFFRLEAHGLVRESDIQIALACGKSEKKRLTINGSERSRLAELYSTARAVVFAPDDVDLVTGSPSGRRQFLDMSISQSDSSYLADLLDYRRVLSQRNALLKSIADSHESMDEIGSRDSLDIWDDRLAELAVRIIRKRYGFVSRVERKASSLHTDLSGLDFQFGVSYNSPVSESDTEVDSFIRILRKRRSRELMLGQTLSGPHRDDLKFTLGGRRSL